MWMYMVYCVGMLNACQGTFYTESSPYISTREKTQAECVQHAVEHAKSEKAKHPALTWMWRCEDYSKVAVEEDKRPFDWQTKQ